MRFGSRNGEGGSSILRFGSIYSPKFFWRSHVVPPTPRQVTNSLYSSSIKFCCTSHLCLHWTLPAQFESLDVVSGLSRQVHNFVLMFWIRRHLTSLQMNTISAQRLIISHWVWTFLPNSSAVPHPEHHNRLHLASDVHAYRASHLSTRFIDKSAVVVRAVIFPVCTSAAGTYALPRTVETAATALAGPVNFFTHCYGCLCYALVVFFALWYGMRRDFRVGLLNLEYWAKGCGIRDGGYLWTDLGSLVFWNLTEF